MPPGKKMKSSAKHDSASHSRERCDKRVQLAIPLRVVTVDAQKRTQLDMACTLDVSMRGARIYGVRPTTQVGDLVTVERGRSKFSCRVVWIGAPNTPQQGQIGVQAVEDGKSLWEKDVREVADQFSAITLDPALRLPEGERKRKLPRIVADLQARIVPQQGGQPSELTTHGRIVNISETGCLLSGAVGLEIGTQVEVIVDLPNTDVALRGRVRHSGQDGLGIEFREIRKSDRQLLRYWLQQLSRPAERAVGAS